MAAGSPWLKPALWGGALVVALVAAALWLQPRPEPQRLRFAATQFLGEQLAFVAYEQGFFKDEGLDIELSYSTAGWQSLKRLFEGQADVATVAQLPVVYAALDRRKYTKEPAGDFVIVADLTVANRAQAAVGRRDRGIATAADLRGKRVAVPVGSTADFFLDAMLREHGLSEADLMIVDTDVTKLPQAIASGEVDAIMGWQPHTSKAQAALGDNAALLEVGYRYPSAWLVVFMKDFLATHPRVAERFLRALERAEAFVASRPEQSLTILAKHLKTDPEKLRAGIEAVGYKLSLSQALLVMMDEQARWAQRRAGQPEAPPDLLRLIDQGPLKSVKPQAISIIQ